MTCPALKSRRTPRRVLPDYSIYPRRAELPSLKTKNELPAQNRVACSKPSYLL
jgi:hypothetical protein